MKNLYALITVLLSYGSLTAQIYYTDVIPDTVITGMVTYSSGDTYLLDIDGDGSTDYHFVKVSYVPPDTEWDFGYIQDGGSGPASNDYMGSDPGGGGIREVFDLNIDDPIGGSGPWLTVGGGNSEFINVLPLAGILSGFWLGDDDGYAGFRFDSAGTECYAWVRMGFAADHSTMTIKEWAWRCDGFDILAGEMPAIPCLPPTGLMASFITTNSADISWTENNSTTEWSVEYGIGGFTLGTGTSVITTSNPMSLSGLSDDTSYDYYVRSICGAGDTSEWSAVGTFTTILDDVGVGENIPLTQISLYPNPANDDLSVQFNKNIYQGEIQIFNLIGQELIKVKFDGSPYYLLDVSSLTSGRYVYQINAEEAVFNGQIFVE